MTEPNIYRNIAEYITSLMPSQIEIEVIEELISANCVRIDLKSHNIRGEARITIDVNNQSIRQPYKANTIEIFIFGESCNGHTEISLGDPNAFDKMLDFIRENIDEKQIQSKI